MKMKKKTILKSFAIVAALAGASKLAYVSGHNDGFDDGFGHGRISGIQTATTDEHYAYIQDTKAQIAELCPPASSEYVAVQRCKNAEAKLRRARLIGN